MVIDLADKSGGWLVAVFRTVAGAYSMLAMTGSIGVMLCRNLRGAISESDDDEQCRRGHAGTIDVGGVCWFNDNVGEAVKDGNGV
jgi:hypothetical protein